MMLAIRLVPQLAFSHPIMRKELFAKPPVVVPRPEFLLIGARGDQLVECRLGLVVWHGQDARQVLSSPYDKFFHDAKTGWLFARAYPIFRRSAFEIWTADSDGFCEVASGVQFDADDLLYTSRQGGIVLHNPHHGIVAEADVPARIYRDGRWDFIEAFWGQGFIGERVVMAQWNGKRLQIDERVYSAQELFGKPLRIEDVYQLDGAYVACAAQCYAVITGQGVRTFSGQVIAIVEDKLLVSGKRETHLCDVRGVDAFRIGKGVFERKFDVPTVVLQDGVAFDWRRRRVVGRVPLSAERIYLFEGGAVYKHKETFHHTQHGRIFKEPCASLRGLSKHGDVALFRFNVTEHALVRFRA